MRTTNETRQRIEIELATGEHGPIIRDEDTGAVTEITSLFVDVTTSVCDQPHPDDDAVWNNVELTLFGYRVRKDGQRTKQKIRDRVWPKNITSVDR